VNGTHESRQLFLVEAAVCSYSAANIDAERSHSTDCLHDVVGIESARKKNRRIDFISYSPADRPIVHSTCASELLHRESRLSRIE